MWILYKLFRLIKSCALFFSKLLIAVLGSYLCAKIKYRLFFGSSLATWYIALKILIVGFICLCLGVVIYNAYKSKWNPAKYQNIAKLSKYLRWSIFFGLFTYSRIGWFLTKRVYTWLFLLLLDIINWDTNILCEFMGFLALMASFEYIKICFKQLSKTDKKDFSLTSSDMKDKFTLNWFIRFICVFCVWEIFLKYSILNLFKKPPCTLQNNI